VIHCCILLDIFVWIVLWSTDPRTSMSSSWSRKPFNWLHLEAVESSLNHYILSLNSSLNAVHNEITDHFIEGNNFFLDKRIVDQLFSFYFLKDFSPCCLQTTSIYEQPIYSILHAVTCHILRSTLMFSFYLPLVLRVFYIILFPVHILYTFLMSSICVPCFFHIFQFLSFRCNYPNNIWERELIIKIDVLSTFPTDFDKNTI